MHDHLKILKMAAKGELPGKIDNNQQIAPLDVFRELINKDYLKAVDASSDDGISFLELKITLDGKQYLAQLETRYRHPSSRRTSRRLLHVMKWGFGIFTAVLTGLLILWLRQVLFGA